MSMICRLNDMQIQHPCIYTLFEWLLQPFPTHPQETLGSSWPELGELGEMTEPVTEVFHRGGMGGTEGPVVGVEFKVWLVMVG